MTAPAIVFGRVPRPAIAIRDIPTSVNVAYDDLGQRVPKFITLHRQVGTNWGTDGWFRTWSYIDANGNVQPGGAQLGRTDYGVDHRTGETLRWTDPLGRVSGYASGPWQRGVESPAYNLVRRYGPNVINRDGISVEVAGQYGDPVSDEAIEQIVEIGAWHADKDMKIPHTSWPINPATGETALVHHGAFQNNKPCAGKVLIGLLPVISKRIGERLRLFQTGVVTAPDATPVPAPAPAPVYARPTRPPVMKVDIYEAVRSIVTVGPDGANRRQTASVNGALTGPPLAPGQRFTALAIVTGDKPDGTEGRWWIGESGSRIWTGATIERPT